MPAGKQYVSGHRIAHVRAIAILADENIHISNRALQGFQEKFLKEIRRVLTAAASVPVTIRFIATMSPILPCPLTFEHEGRLVSYTGRRDPLKDVALVKYLSCGVRDAEGGFYHVLKCVKVTSENDGKSSEDIPPENWLVVFLTTDGASGMNNALAALSSTSDSASWVAPIRIPAQVKAEGLVGVAAFAAKRLGHDLNSKFSHCTLNGWAFWLSTLRAE
jgi:hypothetical protein